MSVSPFVRRIVSAYLGVIALLALLYVIVWPGWAEETFHSRGALSLFTFWTAIVAFCLRLELRFNTKEFLRGMRDGIREFKRHSGF